MSCQHCGADLPPLAMFCGECGRSVSARTAVPPVESRPETPVNARIDPVTILGVSEEAEGQVDRETGQEPEGQVDLEPAPEPEPEAEREPVLEPEPEPEPPAVGACSNCGTSAYPDDLFCAECGHRLANDTNVVAPLRAAALEQAAVIAETGDTRPAKSERAESSAEHGERFVLQFSTGESYTVLGSGLAGRNPHPEPGEVVDHLITIVDPGRSVSKTHLEFGQTDGEFWVSDRHSGNGTVIREAGSDPRVCVPGRRYPVRRGTRIDLGEQYLIVI